MSTNFPKVSILIPTLNAAGVLEKCLSSISTQEYPQAAIEIIIADGGSSDETLGIAKKYGALVVNNTLKTGEAGKMVALNAATGDFIALIDSDNILPYSSWITDMVAPLQKHPEAIGSEPIEYTLRAEDGFITRYCALIGMNDPLTLFLGNYDRMCTLTGKWTEVPHQEVEYDNYLYVTLTTDGVPTIGANGTVFRSSVLKSYAKGDYLFDIDIIAQVIQENGSAFFIKVKNGIIHSFCESDVAKFSRKQKRRVYDFMYHRKTGERQYKWGSVSFIHYVKFIISCVTVLPLLYQTALGFIRKPDTAWLFHIPACEITLWQYSWGVLGNIISPAELTRNQWKQ